MPTADLFDGLLLVDKPKGISSHQVVAEVRRALGQKAVGHSGTLDPAATGVMVVLCGEATKLSEFFLSGDKTYLTEIKLGIETDTWDLDCQTMTEKPVTCNEADVRQVVDDMVGRLDLPVPQFSAVKVNGEKLYEKARRGEVSETIMRTMEFKNVEFLGLGDNVLSVKIHCEKGSYIRSWAYQLGRRLGCGAVVSELRRTRSHPYDIEQAVKLEDLKGLGARQLLTHNSYIHLNATLPDWPSMNVGGKDVVLIRNGQIPNGVVSRLIFDQKQVNREQTQRRFKIFGGLPANLISIIELSPFKAPKIRRNFNAVRVESSERFS